ncbi:MAG: trypsin-like peptidase domain-containing protein [Myxococcaceae bacterium]
MWWKAWCAVLLSTSAFAGSDVVESWAKDRAAEYDRVLSETHEAVPMGQLWRTRPQNEPIPHFTPPTSLAPLVQAVRAGVVNISTRGTSSQQNAVPKAERSLGSGFILSADGYVVTNNHVVENADEIRVRLTDGREFFADVAGHDSATDVALLKLRGSNLHDLPAEYLGDSDSLEVGDWVVAIGNPFGLDYSVSHGMISAKERVIGVGVFDDFIQTDALINPGNSGGPLFNMRGEVIGVNTAIISQGQGIGFSVPISMVKDLLPNLRANGKLMRGWLGVNIQGVGAGLPPDPTQKGAVVKDVYQNSPAAKAGLRPGDRVLAVNGRAVEGYLALLRRIAILAPGSDVKLTVQRPNGPQDITAHLGERPAPEAMQALARANDTDGFGILVREPGGSDPVPPGSGVVVSGVMPGSAAERAGIQAGDVVTELNRHKVTNLDTWRQAADKSAQEQSLLLKIQRGESTRYLAVER